VRERAGLWSPARGVKARGPWPLHGGPRFRGGKASLRRTPAPSADPDFLERFEQERTRWDPKDRELWVTRTRPEETLVEVRSGTDVQIVRQSCL
jgi:hypothetical protein